MEQLKKVYVEKEEFEKINSAFEVLKSLDNNETAKKNINYELPIGICLGEVVNALDLILDMCEIVKD